MMKGNRLYWIIDQRERGVKLNNKILIRRIKMYEASYEVRIYVFLFQIYNKNIKYEPVRYVRVFYTPCVIKFKKNIFEILIYTRFYFQQQQLSSMVFYRSAFSVSSYSLSSDISITSSSSLLSLSLVSLPLPLLLLLLLSSPVNKAFNFGKTFFTSSL